MGCLMSGPGIADGAEKMALVTTDQDNRATANLDKVTPPHDIENNKNNKDIIKRRDTKGEPVREIARTFNVSHKHDFTA
jgi:hypothetical protein